jgi:hypothetical protein
MCAIHPSELDCIALAAVGNDAVKTEKRTAERTKSTDPLAVKDGIERRAKLVSDGAHVAWQRHFAILKTHDNLLNLEPGESDKTEP